MPKRLIAQNVEKVPRLIEFVMGDLLAQSGTQDGSEY
jgi:hypothetical protein